MTADFDKFASDLGYTQDKLASSMKLFANLVNYAEADQGGFDKMAEERVGTLAPLWMLFEKQAEAEGYDLANSPADKVVVAFNDYVKQAEEEAKKDDKDEKKKEEEEQEKKASLHFQKVAYQAQQEELFRHLGEVAADAMLQKLAGEQTRFSFENDSVTDKAKNLKEDLRNKAHGTKESIQALVKKHPGAAKGIGAAAGLAAVGGAAAAGYKHFKKKDSDGPASEEKKAFDLQAAKVAVALVKQAQDSGAKVSVEAAVDDMNAVLYKLAQEGGNEESEQVKQASAAGNGPEALNIRACELLSMAGYSWLEKRDARQPLSHRDLVAVEHPDSSAPSAHDPCSRNPRTEWSRSESGDLPCAHRSSSSS